MRKVCPIAQGIAKARRTYITHKRQCSKQNSSCTVTCQSSSGRECVCARLPQLSFSLYTEGGILELLQGLPTCVRYVMTKLPHDYRILRLRIRSFFSPLSYSVQYTHHANFRRAQSRSFGRAGRPGGTASLYKCSRPSASYGYCPPHPV